jgi:peptidoglycan/xylan/chitin deacetylase (PgdA/CDA1 family)
MRHVVAFATIVGSTLFGPTLAAAAQCPGNPDALGTSRTLVVDPTEHPRLGSMQYHETLPLEDHEIVLTFDDGPLPPRSTRVLEILEHECVKATFFLIGKMAHTFPDGVRRIRDAGHTIGTHSYSHPLSFHRMPQDKAQFEINEGIASVTSALGDDSGPAPFFRIPGLLRVEGVEHYLAAQNIQVWSADEVADDWLRIEPGQVYSRALQRIEANRKGILLLHDIQPKTVEALPYLLRELKRRGYRVVHVVPATPDRPKTATDPDQWVMHAHLSPRPPIPAETEPGLPAANPASFGLEVASNSISFLHGIAVARDPAWQPRPLLARDHSPSPLLPASTWPRGFETTPDASSWLGRHPSLALSPQDFGYPRDSVRRAESSGAVSVDEIQRLLESLPDENVPPVDNRKILQLLHPAPAAPAPPQALRGPAANAVIPRGAFP